MPTLRDSAYGCILSEQNLAEICRESQKLPVGNFSRLFRETTNDSCQSRPPSTRLNDETIDFGP